jgi:hypothetical protein
MIQWATELIQQRHYNTVRLCFFVPGHAKNDVDRLFARIAHAYNNNDVLVTEHLLALIQETIKSTGKCIQATSHDIMNWKALLTKKYVALSEIKSYRDFLIKHNDEGKVVVFHKTCCYEGEYICSNLIKRNVDAGLNLRDGAEKYTYEARGMTQELSKEKMADLTKMYDRLIAPSLRPEWLPIQPSTPIPKSSATSPSANLARQHRAELKKKMRNRPKSNRT